MKYEVIQTPYGGEAIQGIDETGLVHHIPSDPANSDYQNYLAWLEEQK